MYRPHFAFDTPAGYFDELAIFPFDQRNAPGTGGGNIGTIEYSQILRLDNDASFLWRAIAWDYPDNYYFLDGQVAVRIQDPYSQYLSSDWVPILLLAQFAYVLQPWTPSIGGPPVGPNYTSPIAGGMAVPLADEIFCPATSTIRLDLMALNEAGFAGSNCGRLMAIGVKRRQASDCPKEFQ